ncbi:DUF6629 family protein [Sphingomonas nostoxanthinifaciens]|uniref:DUF6629 family protein n=1 Tax=Sphingomonas nostoxanthinifaciens TaxID=2872652 RepID=UPI0029542C03|nr:DUF6629 family protein [Sphingomonas nostoxanthinifaciens]UAK24273.1 hypothetical protein K8P63_18430 [Sphingomonas nostoxanthinifaciens]
MCFSPTASFTSAALIATIGVATLRHVRSPNMLLFAATPLLFAVHQFSEGMVWLGLDGQTGPFGLKLAAFVFTMYAQGILPFLMPLAVLLMEPRGSRRWRVMIGLTAIGAIAAAWDAYGLLTLPTHVFVDHNSIAYRNVMTGSLFISLLYILATCGSLLLSSFSVVRWYGVLNICALTIVEIVRDYAFASVWCFYAALMSIMIYWQFRQHRLDAATS